MMLDQSGDGGLLGHRPERAKSEPAVGTALDEAERGRGGEQPFGCFRREPEIRRQVAWRHRSRLQQVEKPQAHAGVQDL